jgi:hypothetical protein
VKTLRINHQSDQYFPTHRARVSNAELTEGEALMGALNALSKASCRQLLEIRKEFLQAQFDWLCKLEKQRRGDEAKQPHGRRVKKHK